MTVNPIGILDYDYRWPQLYQDERTKIRAVIGDSVVAIEHIGSTAVPGLGAKPIIDIMASLRKIGDVEKCIRPLENINYEYLGEYGIPGRHYFRKPPVDPAKRTYHLHIVEVGSDLWNRHLLFRDYLRTHPEVAANYYELKKELARKFRSNRDTYTDAKTSFIASVVEKARLHNMQ